MFSRFLLLAVAFAMVLMSVGTASAFKLYIEAEASTTPIKAPLEIKTDKKTAFGGKYIVAPNGVGNDGNAIATYEFTAPNDGKYRFWGRGISPTGDDDSFYWGIDVPAPKSAENCGGKMPGDQLNIWDPGNPITDWTWTKIDSRNCYGATGQDQVVLDLKRGKYVLTIVQREDGTELDGLLVTDENLTDNQLPKTEAEARALQVAVESKGKLATAWGALKAQR